MSSTSNTSKAEVSDFVSSDQEYEVFLSFRGPDTRAGFIDHLYERLIDADVRVYKDDEELRKGKEIGPELHQAINGSAIAVPIFSKRYVESKWCLNELVEINKRRRSGEMMVMPIFYYVKPSEVRDQTGDYEKAFALHERNYGTGNAIIGEWKAAMSEISKLSGWEIPSNTYSGEVKLVEDLTKEIYSALKKGNIKSIPDHLVGLSDHVEKILEMLSLETDGVRIIGIHGMGGIGKTTLAKVVYNGLFTKFEGSSFLDDARSQDLEDLKKKMRSDLDRKSSNCVDNKARFVNKKVFIVIDDVDKETQIEDLIGKRGKQDRFASGSRIIMTSRNKGFLRRIPVDESYELTEMNPVQSLQLFCKHAFESDEPKEDYTILSKQIVETTGGLPLALEVIGSSLRNESMDQWEGRLERLKDVPDDDVMQKLRISYDGLSGRQKHIFLDIACFFIGNDQRLVIHFWDPREFHPKEAMSVLQQKSLIKVDGNRLWMHDQLRDLGREIVREGNIMNPEKQTRLWNLEEGTKILMTKREKENIQGIRVEFNEKSHPYFTEEGFAKLSKVRLFWVEKKLFFNYPSNFLPKKPLFHTSFNYPSNFLPKKPLFHTFFNYPPPHSESNIFSEVRWLSWPHFPHRYIKTSNFSFSNLTILTLTDSSVTSDWDGWNQIKMASNLKVLDLRGCSKLVKTLNFSSHPKLEQLILQGCSGLVEIDESIGMLKHLVHLNLRSCESLRKLPKEMSCMESLTKLIIGNTGIVEIPWLCSMVKLVAFDAYYCTSLKHVSLNGLTSIKKLSLGRCRITSIPDSIRELVNLLELSLQGCELLKELPEAIGELVNLLELDLEGCRLLKKLPETIGALVSLIRLRICYSGIEELPNSIGYLESLKLLDVSGTPITELPATIEKARKLEEINASYCDDLIRLPMLPESLIVLKLPRKIMAMMPDLSNLTNLKQLDVLTSKFILRQGARCYLIDPKPSWLKELASVQSPSPWWIGKLSKAEHLNLAFLTITTLHSDLGALSQLKELELTYCHWLQSIPKLPLNLTTLRISDCESLERISDLSHLEKLTTLFVRDTALVKLQCPPALVTLSLVNCCDLVEIRGRSEYLWRLDIIDCYSLVRIPDVLNLETLGFLSITRCPKLCRYGKSHNGPILTDNSLKSEPFMSDMLKMCGYSPSTSCLEKRKAEGKGKEIEEMG